MINEKSSIDDCIEEKSINETFGSVCYTKTSILIDGTKFELAKREINLWYPKIRIFNQKLYVMFYSGDNQTINLNIFRKTGKGAILVSHDKIDNGLEDEPYFTISDKDFYVLGKKIIIAIDTNRTIYYAVWDRSNSGRSLNFIGVFDDKLWLELSPTLVGSGENVVLFFRSGVCIVSGCSGGITLVSKFIDKENHFEHPRVFEWAHLKTRDSSPVNMIKVDNNENIFYKAMENDKYYKTNYNDLSQIQTTDEIFRDIFSF